MGLPSSLFLLRRDSKSLYGLRNLKNPHPCPQRNPVSVSHVSLSSTRHLSVTSLRLSPKLLMDALQYSGPGLSTGKRMNRRLAVLATHCLQSPPQEEAVRQLPRLNERKSRTLLRWLDEGGLSLYFSAHLSTFGMGSNLPYLLQDEINDRLSANQIRMQAMLAEFARVNSSLQSRSISFKFVKGFSLSPYFCPSIDLRHQTDIDVLVSRSSLPDARRVLVESGYSVEVEHPTGEIRLVSSPHDALKHNHTIYGIPSFNRVELHQTIWEARQGIPLNPPEQCFAPVEIRKLNGITYPALSIDGMFLLQLLHAFRHLLSSWIRQSWLFEICYFINQNREDDEFWERFVELVSQDQQTSNACGTVLALCSSTFKVNLPAAVNESLMQNLPQPIREWVRLCGEIFALSDMSGTKLHRMIHTCFLSGSAIATSRAGFPLLPSSKRFLSVVRGRMRDPAKSATSVPRFLLKRSWFHMSALVEYLWYSYRWRRALASQ